MTANRDDLYQRFGPLLLEAVVRLMLAEINKLRKEAGLPERTLQQVVESLQTQVDSLEGYPWMEDDHA